MISFEDLPRGLPREISTKDGAPRAIWTPAENLLQSPRWQFQTGAPLIGQDRHGNWICLDDDRHLFTLAGSRAGKGISMILPNLDHYIGSVMCLDPKGENATLTAQRRAELGQEVFAFDPFHAADVPDEYRANFNPLEDLDPTDPLFVDLCDSIAESLVVAENGKDNDHWNASGRMTLRGFIAWVASSSSGPRDLVEVYRLLHLGSIPAECRMTP